MKKDIKELQPAIVWNNFAEICNIPHPSKRMKAICDFVEHTGKNLGLETKRDVLGNILIKKPATTGMENRKTVALQAHLDMVPQKNGEVQFDFLSDPIQPRIDGNWLKATETTLGADNGIGVAAILAVLQSQSLSHGPIEALFTTDEEIGMIGAFGIKPDFLSAEILLNLDSEEDGELVIGCAGGLLANTVFRYQEEKVPEGDIAVEIAVKGLLGGHSGIDIHLGRANANKLMFRFLRSAVMDCEARLSAISGGDLHNAIPRESTAIITIPQEGLEDLQDLCEEMQQTFKEEYGLIDPGVVIMLKQTDLPQGIMPEMVQDDLINALVACPNGVIRYSPEMPDVVESSCNLSIVKTKKGEVNIVVSIRSLRESVKANIAAVLESIFSLAGGFIEFDNNYSGWIPSLNSPILEVIEQIIISKKGVKPIVKVIHAGLECGIIGSLYPKLDMISFGPTIKHPHSPDEKVDIESVQRFWDLLCSTLRNIPYKVN